MCSNFAFGFHHTICDDIVNKSCHFKWQTLWFIFSFFLSVFIFLVFFSLFIYFSRLFLSLDVLLLSSVLAIRYRVFFFPFVETHKSIFIVQCCCFFFWFCNQSKKQRSFVVSECMCILFDMKEARRTVNVYCTMYTVQPVNVNGSSLHKKPMYVCTWTVYTDAHMCTRCGSQHLATTGRTVNRIRIYGASI